MTSSTSSLTAPASPGAPYSEEILSFPCAGEILPAVLARPAGLCRGGVLLIVGGPQYRVGSHRQFLLLSRRLAAEGYAVLRFDYRGMGDASGDLHNFEQVNPDIRAALDAFAQACPSLGAGSFQLWGLCDAASAALMYLHAEADARVGGLVLLNPWVRSVTSQARAQVKHYYAQKLFDKAFWLKLLRGEVAVFGAVAGFVKTWLASRRAAPAAGAAGKHTPALSFQTQMAKGWARGLPKLLILSGHDLTAREFIEYAGTDAAWQGLLARPEVERHDLADADHTFSNAEARRQVENLTLSWLQRTVG